MDFRQIERSEVSVKSMKPSIEVIDLRQEFKSETKLSHIQHLESLVIWGEAEKNSRITCLDRYSLNPSDNLAIWTIPPGLIELQAAILRVKPRKVYFFANDPGMDNPKSFLERLLGLIKYRIKHSQGNTTISYLATATAQKTSTAKLGLEWLIAKGYITIKSIADDEIMVENAGNRVSKDGSAITTLLNSALSESAAFRRYYIKADPDRLILFIE